METFWFLDSFKIKILEHEKVEVLALLFQESSSVVFPT